MEPVGFILGVVTFNTLVKFGKPLRRAAVFTASQALGVADRMRTAAYGLKEEFEDIVAEAHYENMKARMNVMKPASGNENNQVAQGDTIQREE